MHERRNVNGPKRQFPSELKREVIEYYLSNEYSKRVVWEKFIGKDEERGRILRWMRQLGYIDYKTQPHRHNKFMSQKRDTKKADSKSYLGESELIKKLRKEVEEEKLRALAYSKMIDIAEKEFKIPIRKKYNTKP